jgi:hypothetical protein
MIHDSRFRRDLRFKITSALEISSVGQSMTNLLWLNYPIPVNSKPLTKIQYDREHQSIPNEVSQAMHFH